MPNNRWDTVIWLPFSDFLGLRFGFLNWIYKSRGRFTMSTNINEDGPVFIVEIMFLKRCIPQNVPQKVECGRNDRSLPMFWAGGGWFWDPWSVQKSLLTSHLENTVTVNSLSPLRFSRLTAIHTTTLVHINTFSLRTGVPLFCHLSFCIETHHQAFSGH